MKKNYNPDDYFPISRLPQNNMSYNPRKKNSRSFNPRDKLKRINSLIQQPCKKCKELGLNKKGIGRIKLVVRNNGTDVIVCIEHQDFYSYKKRKK